MPYTVLAEVKVARPVREMSTITITETVDFSTLSKNVRLRLLAALRTGLSDARTGKVAVLYKALCKHYGVPYAFYGKGSHYERKNNRWVRVTSAVIHVSNDFDDEFLSTISAMGALSGDAGSPYYGYSTRSTNMDKSSVREAINKELATELLKFNDIIELVKEGGTFTFPTTVID